MAKRKAAKLPTPTQVIPARQPVSPRGGTYAAIARASDRHLAKAEEALRSAALLWSDVDSGLETTFEELAAQMLDERRRAVEMVSDLYGDRLNEAAV